MTTLADSSKIASLVEHLAGQINQAIVDSGSSHPWAIVGIRSRGDLLAQRIATLLDPALISERLGVLDITLYRDDLSEITHQPVVRTTEIPFDIDGMNIVLVDDVLMSGRSIRAALQSLMDLGRPRRIWLAVLVDRGGRELPICPDFVAVDLKDEPLTSDMIVDVHLTPLDEVDQITTHPKQKGPTT
jgi:pyrimidine operon attenuation protein/uracil phosphoribosyltransferase